MGSIIETDPASDYSAEMFVQVVAVAPLERVELIRSGREVAEFDAAGELDVTLQSRLEGLVPGEYVYVRAIQADGGAAWSSPIFVAAQGPGNPQTPRQLP